MPPIKSSSVKTLTENPEKIFLESTSVLIKIASNIIQNPTNEKYRSLRLGNAIVTEKLIPAVGALECLFEMGFQEGNDNIYLPKTSSLETVKQILKEIQTVRQNYKTSSTQQQSVQSAVASNTGAVPKIVRPSTSKPSEPAKSKSFVFLQGIIKKSEHVMLYENKQLQKKALSCIPIIELNLRAESNVRKLQLAVKKKEVEAEEVDYQEMLLIELLNWFKTEFFKWVDKPVCKTCNTNEMVVSCNKGLQIGGNRVEVYTCTSCHKDVFFTRHNNPEKLLQTREGRCGEWANCFTLLCRSMGWEARYVCDETDHVWTEVYLQLKKRWLHCDPCENIIDTPLIYECGWNKQLSYIIAYSFDDVQDVTWRYSCDHDTVRSRRTLCSEQELIEVLFKIREVRQKELSVVRRKYLAERNVKELIELMSQKKLSDAEKQGRSSGSIAWRLARGETSTNTGGGHVWSVKPNSNSQTTIIYSVSKDKYECDDNRSVPGWDNGVYQVSSVFRKEERDWKMVYLCRKENAGEGQISWKFKVEVPGTVIDKINIKMKWKTFESGVVTCLLCSADSCVKISDGEFETSALSGSQEVELKVQLQGGNGDCAWQHAQLFREETSCDTMNPSLSVTFFFKNS